MSTPSTQKGSITFTPDKQYVGTPAPATLKRVDKNGTEVTATYTPTGDQGNANQHWLLQLVRKGLRIQPEAQPYPRDPAVPIDLDNPMTFEDGKTIGLGPGRKVNMPSTLMVRIPSSRQIKQYVGTPAAVVVKRVDKNGNGDRNSYADGDQGTPTSEDVTNWPSRSKTNWYP